MVLTVGSNCPYLMTCIKVHASEASKGNPCEHCRASEPLAVCMASERRELLPVLHAKRAKRALVCAAWQASEASPCVRATAGPPQELAKWARSAQILLLNIKNYLQHFVH